MKDETYTQCILQKSEVQRTSWIPSSFASVNRVLRLKDGDTWTNGWIVKEAGKTMDAKYVLDNERNYLKQRIASDI